MPRRSACTRAMASCASALCAPWGSSSAAGWTASSCSGRWARATLHRQHHFSLDLARGHQPQSVGCFFKGIYFRDMRAQLPLAEPQAELSDAAGEGLRLAAREVAPEHSHHRSALEEREVQRQLGNLAGGEADHEQPSAPGDGAERRLAVGAADRVVDDVDSAPLGKAFDALAQIFGGVVMVASAPCSRQTASF